MKKALSIKLGIIGIIMMLAGNLLAYTNTKGPGDIARDQNETIYTITKKGTDCKTDTDTYCAKGKPIVSHDGHVVSFIDCKTGEPVTLITSPCLLEVKEGK